MVGDPPNIIIASAADIGFVDFTTNVAPVAFVCMAATLAIVYFWFRHRVTASPEARREVMARNLSETIKDKKLLIQSGVVFGLTVLGFLTHELFDVSPAFVAVAGAGLLLVISGIEPSEILDRVEWTTLAFFTGLFILVGSLVETGVTAEVQEWMVDITGENERNLAFVIIWVSGLASAVVDNIPFTATMTPVVSELAAEGGSQVSPLWWSLVLGADLGGNITAVGASANVIIVSLARARGYPISFVKFLAYGAVIGLVSLVISTGYMWLRYYP